VSRGYSKPETLVLRRMLSKTNQAMLSYFQSMSIQTQPLKLYPPSTLLRKRRKLHRGRIEPVSWRIGSKSKSVASKISEQVERSMNPFFLRRS
jgi:hypothetical protein